MKISILFIAISALILSSFTACAENTEIVKNEKNFEETIIEKENKLVIYSGRSESLVAPIIDEFSALTGITVSVKYGKTGALVSLLQEEGVKSPADVFYAQDPGGLGAVSDMLTPMSSELCDIIPSWAVSVRAADNSCKWIGITGRARVLVYNPNVLSEADLPTSMDDLTDPKWNGKLGWAPTNGSFQAMVTGMRIYWGEEKTKSWLEGIMANQPIVYPKNTPQVQAVADEEIQIGMVNHYYLHRFIADKGESFSARNHYLDNGDAGSVVLVSGTGILDVSDNKGNAERFITFMTSKIAQQYFATQVHEYSLITDGVKQDRLLRDLDSMSKPDIDISQLGDLENTQALLMEVGALQ